MVVVCPYSAVPEDIWGVTRSNTGVLVNVFQDGDVIAPELTPLKRDWHMLEQDDEDSDGSDEDRRPGPREGTPRKPGHNVKVKLFQAQEKRRL